MSYEPTGTEQLFLWRLAVAGGGDWNKGLKPAIDAKTRKKLVADGLIEEESRKPASGGRGAMYLSLADRGWSWLSGHLDGEMKTRANSLETFRLLLGRLKLHMDASGLSLAEFLCPSSIPTRMPPEPTDLEGRITEVYGRLSGGRPNVRVRLAALRPALADVAREHLDSALLAMDIGGRAALYRLDNPLEIDDADREALLRTPAGDERHVIYLGEGGS